MTKQNGWRSATTFLDECEAERGRGWENVALTHFGRRGRSLEDAVLSKLASGRRTDQDESE